MANQPLSALIDSTRDTGFLGRIEIQIAATAWSVYNNGASSATRKQYAKDVYLGRKSFAEQWSAAVRTSGANITKETLADSDIESAVGTVFEAFVPTEEA